jgi:hypothetical protein
MFEVIRTNDANRCRGCGAPINGATPLKPGTVPWKTSDNDQPSVSICGYCATVALFTHDLGLRPPTMPEQFALDNDLVFQAELADVRRFIAWRQGQAER